MAEIYLDNAATMRVDSQAIKKTIESMRNNYGNPSSLHRLGVRSALMLEEAREQVSSVIGAKSSELIFTSGGSESNMISLLGALKPKFRNGKKIITSSVEHKSVLLCAKKLEALGYEICCLKPNRQHQVSVDELSSLVDGDTALVSVMQVNNETGDIFEIEKLAKAVKLKNPKTLFHCDAVQSFGKLPILVDELGVDMLSISGHKLGAGKGVGALFLRLGLKASLVDGGAQEFGLRMGTENVPGIVGFSAVCEGLNQVAIRKKAKKVTELNKALRCALETEIDEVFVNSGQSASPYILNFSILGVKAQVLQNWLQEYGVFVSIGAACSKNQKSYVLKEFGIDDKRIDSAIRVSFSANNNEEEVKSFVVLVKKAAQELRGINTKGLSLK